MNVFFFFLLVWYFAFTLLWKLLCFSELPRCQAVDKEAALWVALPAVPLHCLLIPPSASFPCVFPSCLFLLLLFQFIQPNLCPSRPPLPPHAPAAHHRPLQHTCRPRSGTCLCLWGPVYSSSFTCGLCKSGITNSSSISIDRFPSFPSTPSTISTTTTSSRSTRTITTVWRCFSPGRSLCPREAHPEPPDTGRRPLSGWSPTWRGESRRYTSYFSNCTN